MKQDNQKMNRFLHEEGLFDTIDEQRIFRAVQAKSKRQRKKGTKKVFALMVASLLLIVLVGFTTFPYLSRIIDDYFGDNFSTLLTVQKGSSATKKGITIRLLHYFQDNGVYYSVVSIEGTDQRVTLDLADVPGVSMIRDITPDKEQDTQFFLFTSFARLSELEIKALQTAPLTINEQIQLSSIEDLATNQYQEISRSAIISSTFVAETMDQLKILDGELKQTDAHYTIEHFGMIQDQIHFQLQSRSKSMNNLSLSIMTDTGTEEQPVMSYLFEHGVGTKKTYLKEFVFDSVDLKKVTAINISGKLFTDKVSADWILDMEDPVQLPMKIFESEDKAVSITVSPLSVQIQTPYTGRLKGESVIAEDSEGQKQELTSLAPQNQQKSNDMTYITYYNDLDQIKKIYIGEEVFYLLNQR